MDYELTEEQEALLDDAERMVRREKFTDFINSPRIFFNRLRSGYYDEKLVYNLRWLVARQNEEE